MPDMRARARLGVRARVRVRVRIRVRVRVWQSIKCCQCVYSQAADNKTVEVIKNRR